MLKVLVAYLLLAGVVLAQQHVLDDVKVDEAQATTTYPWPGKPLPSPRPREAITIAVKQFAQQLMQNAKIQGLSIGVVRPDNSVELASLGLRSEQGDRMTPDTRFVIASCSKAFLTASVGVLIDDFAQGRNKTSLPSGVQKLDWHTRVTDLLPDDWKLMDEWATEKATLLDLFSHQTGLPRHDFSYKPADKPLDVLHRMQHLRPAFELRQRWHYNNQMFVLGAHLISTYSGMSYVNYVQERIFGPLNMTSTTFSPNKALESGKRSEGWHSDGRLIPFWFTEDMIELNAGQGGIISTAEDMTRWIRMMLNEGVDPTTNKTIIPKSTYTEVTTIHSIVSGRTSQSYFSPASYGLGWQHKIYQGHETIEHGGAIPGFSTEVIFLPFDKLGIVVLANGAGKHQQELSVIYRIIEDYLSLPRKESDRLAKLTLQGTSELAPTVVVNSASSDDEKTPPSLPISAYAGHYHDAGYGTFTLCAPTPTPSMECTAVLHAFAPFHNVSDTSRTELYASVDSLWISHLRFVHTSGDTFALEGAFLFPDGYGRDKSAFKMGETGGTEVAEFVVRDGEVLGLALNGLVGETTNAVRRGGSVEETAEVWLKKI